MRTLPHAIATTLLLTHLSGDPAVLLAGELPPQQAYELLEELRSEDAKTRGKAFRQLEKANDPTIAAALLELVFFSPTGRAEAVELLERLLGKEYGPDYKAWIEEIGRRPDLQPKPGYLAFKGQLYSKIDPAFAEFLDPKHPRTLRPEEIVWGGVKKDGIPALENPHFIPAPLAGFLQDDEPVFGVAIDGVVKAYPHRILDWHEMCNDVIGGRAVSLSYCTLCGSGILFDTTLPDGRTFTFGSSGMLYRSNKLMYDRQTNTLWSNLTGEPVMGELVGSGIVLDVLPLVVTTWGAWKEQYPGTLVVSRNTGHQRDYTPGAAYGKYFASPDLMFPVWQKPDAGELGLKDWIWTVVVDRRRKAYPLEKLKARPVLHDAVGGVPVLLLTDPQSEAVRVYRTEGRRFRVEAGGALIDEATGERFERTEEALLAENGDTTLERLPGHRAYWFGWYAFFPEGEVYQE